MATKLPINCQKSLLAMLQAFLLSWQGLASRGLRLACLIPPSVLTCRVLDTAQWLGAKRCGCPRSVPLDTQNA